VPNGPSALVARAAVAGHAALARSGEIHVWSVTIADWLPFLVTLGTTLNGDECDRAARFHFERDRRRFTVCRGLLRALLGNYLALDPRQIEFHLGPHEKPELATSITTRLEFNLSHSGDAACFAFAAGRQVGVDIERMRSQSDLNGLAQQVFTPAEIEAFSASPEQQREDLFFTLWTRKEALIKAIGLGLSAPVREITVTHGLAGSGETTGIGLIERDGACWSLMSLPAPEGYKSAIAVEGRLSPGLLHIQPLEPAT
jgi:4'-phosphopantetheinyl transferase